MKGSRRKGTLRYKFVIGFIMVTVPLIVFLFYNNYYAMNVVREQVSQSNINLISTQVAKKDIALEKTVSYLLKQSANDTSHLNLLALSTYPPDSGEYFFAKQAMLQLFDEDQGAYKEVDTFFVYSVMTDELIASQRSYDSIQRYHHVLGDYLKDKTKLRFHEWDIVHEGDRYYLVQIEQADPEVYIGALIDMNSLIDELRATELDNQLETLLVSDAGEPLVESLWSAEDVKQIEESLKEPGDQAYRKFIRSEDGLGYLVVSAKSLQAPFHMVATVPEKDMLKPLLYFQLAIYLIPVAGLIVILLYSFFLKRTLLQPMQALMSGMRRIMHGDWNVRLNEGTSFEFAFLIDTFNSMVSQISKLKIDLYEGMLKKQEAEFKHLQAQINPHFYLNSLNIIYSLSALRKNDLVEKMTEHLADYFRFITQTHREFITLAEEINHITNYLEIQKLRFPDKLSFSIRLPDRYARCLVPPLTIQPFVENAIIHGMKEGSLPFVIQMDIRSSTEDSADYEVEITDNGRGLAPDKLRELQAGSNDETGGQGAGGLGIWNVKRRLAMIYGSRAQVFFGNGEQEGAVVRVRLPLELEIEGGDAGV